MRVWRGQGWMRNSRGVFSGMIQCIMRAIVYQINKCPNYSGGCRNSLVANLLSVLAGFLAFVGFSHGLAEEGELSFLGDVAEGAKMFDGFFSSFMFTNAHNSTMCFHQIFFNKTSTGVFSCSIPYL